MNVPKTPWSQWLGWAGSEAADPGAAGLPDASAEEAADEFATDAATVAREAPLTLNENPNVDGSG